MFDGMVIYLILTQFPIIYSAAGALILRISHGYEVKEDNDPFIDLADRGMATFSDSTVPGVWMVDILPFSKAVFRCTILMH